jgi:glycerol-3-phosphate dehydrogenase (NAD(P)+)
MKKISVIGGGSWGTALAVLCHKNGHRVTIWTALEWEVELLRKEREHIHRLPGIKISEEITIEDDLEKACTDQDLIIFAVASPFVRETAKRAARYIQDGQIIVNVAKGIEDHTLMTLCQVIEKEIPGADVAVLSGPSHAEEVSKGIPTTVVAGAKSKVTAEIIQDTFMNERFRVYTNPDIIGIELGGSLKNVIALAAGIIDGIGMGDNTKAALMTRGIAEISRLGVAAGGKFETFCGLSGIGDLIVTCTSKHSRNHNAGYYLGQGYSFEETKVKIGQVIEGANTVKAALDLAAKFHITMPIMEQVDNVLFEGKEAKKAVESLLKREKRIEYHTLSW